MKRRGLGQRFALACAVVGYAAGAAAVIGATWWAATRGTGAPIFASLAALAVFLCGTGIVCHVIGAADLPDLRIGGGSHRS